MQTVNQMTKYNQRNHRDNLLLKDFFEYTREKGFYEREEEERPLNHLNHTKFFFFIFPTLPHNQLVYQLIPEFQC